MCIHRHPLGGRNFESFSEDPYLTGKLASAHVRGVQSRGIAATPKHFVGKRNRGTSKSLHGLIFVNSQRPGNSPI